MDTVGKRAQKNIIWSCYTHGVMFRPRGWVVNSTATRKDKKQGNFWFQLLVAFLLWRSKKELIKSAIVWAMDILFYNDEHSTVYLLVVTLTHIWSEKLDFRFDKLANSLRDAHCALCSVHRTSLRLLGAANVRRICMGNDKKRKSISINFESWGNIDNERTAQPPSPATRIPCRPCQHIEINRQTFSKANKIYGNSMLCFLEISLPFLAGIQTTRCA